MGTQAARGRPETAARYGSFGSHIQDTGAPGPGGYDEVGAMGTQAARGRPETAARYGSFGSHIQDTGAPGPGEYDVVGGMGAGIYVHEAPSSCTSVCTSSQYQR